jgi:hypothetical protein
MLNDDAFVKPGRQGLADQIRVIRALATTSLALVAQFLPCFQHVSGDRVSAVFKAATTAR